MKLRIWKRRDAGHPWQLECAIKIGKRTHHYGPLEFQSWSDAVRAMEDVCAYVAKPARGFEAKRKPLRFEKRRVTIYSPGAQPAFPDGLYAEELVFPDGFPEPSEIEACYDLATKTMRLFVKELE